MRRLSVLLLLAFSLAGAAPPLLRLRTLSLFPSSPDREGARLPAGFRRPPELRPSPPDSPVLEVGPGVSEPVPVIQPSPSIPPICFRSGFSATFAFEAIIASDGTVQAIRALTSKVDTPRPQVLEAAARDALLQWRFRPATRHGVPVPVFITQTLTFRFR